MFEGLSQRLGAVLDGLRRRGALSEADVDAALREVRVALLEADVALSVVKSFIADVRKQAIGADVVRSVTPGQMVVKIVYDALVATLGDAAPGIDLQAVPPVPILMVGLQGSGKTTSTAKIAHRLQTRDKRRVLMASLDVRRPAAQEQLRILGEQADVATLPIVANQLPVDIARRAIEAARLGGYDVVMLDTAGRLHVDDALMAEVAAVRDIAKPHETLLVVDALTGQDAVNVATAFGDRIDLTGIVLTRVDGDGRGGAALSMRAVTGKPIKLIGVGEKLEDLEDFHPDRIAQRILGMGDIVSLVEKAAATFEQEKAERMAKKLAKGEFDLDDLVEQFRQMRKMGGMQGLMAMLPGVGKMQRDMAGANMDDKSLGRQEAIILSMTAWERRNPKELGASRKRRIAAGSGTKVEDINRLLKMHRQMADMMKTMGKMGGKGFLRSGLGAALGLKGGMPQMPAGMPQMPQMPQMPGAQPTNPFASPQAPKGLLPGLGGPKVPFKK
jgi:signal recognition particle subunit SRP54